MSDAPPSLSPAPVPAPSDGLGLALDRFEVDGFRGLRNLTLDGLGAVTLLVGANNTGKTSILEALAIGGNPLDPREWGRVAGLRSTRRSFPYWLGDADICWLFPKARDPDATDGEHGTIALGGSGRRSFHVTATCSAVVGRPSPSLSEGIYFFPPGTYRTAIDSGADIDAAIEGQLDESSPEQDGWLFRITVDTDFQGRSPESGRMVLEFPVWSRSGIFLRVPTNEKRAPRILPIVFLTPYGHRDQAATVQRFSDAVDEGRRDDLLSLLRGFDPETEAIEIGTIEEGQRPALKVKLRRCGVVPVSALGDGMRRALAMALAVERARGGLLLIDEIESALHVSALDRLFPWLVEACRRFDVQLFATTHSLEAIDAIAKLAGSHDSGGLVAFNLGERDPDDGSPKRYSARMIHRLVHERGLDVR